ncbi:hypothetical protein AB3S75_043308 [Citrus x aurantiifolia]
MGFSLHLQEIVGFCALIFSIICVYAATSNAKRNKKGGRKPPERQGHGLVTVTFISWQDQTS